MSTLIELSHPLRDGMPAFPGLPPARIGAILDHEATRPRYEGRAEFFLGRVELACNTGTYLDSPFHRFPGRDDLAAVPLERIVGLDALVVDAPDHPGPVKLDPSGLAGRAVLVRTGRDRRWETDEYWENGPFLDAPTAAALVRAGVTLVGVDFGNVDDMTDPARPAHTALLEAGIPIVENLRGLEALPQEGFRFSAPVLAIAGGASFPVRAYAELQSARRSALRAETAGP